MTFKEFEKLLTKDRQLLMRVKEKPECMGEGGGCNCGVDRVYVEENITLLYFCAHCGHKYYDRLSARDKKDKKLKFQSFQYLQPARERLAKAFIYANTKTVLGWFPTKKDIKEYAQGIYFSGFRRQYWGKW